MTKTYPSKVSYGLLVFVFLVFFAPLIPVFLSEGLNTSLWGLTGFLTLVFGFVLHLFLKTTYTIDGHMLKIQCGLIPFRPVAIDEMREIARTKTLLSAPAPSFDRMAIRYGEYGYLVISPKDKLDLVNELLKINPAIITHITEN